eukprot:Gb_17722 [translate_table: standard]
MHGHQSVQAAHKFPSDEHRGQRRFLSHQSEQYFLHFGTLAVLIQFADSRIDAQAAEKPFDDMAHAAGCHTEHDHRILHCQSLNFIHRRLLAAFDGIRTHFQLWRPINAW